MNIFAALFGKRAGSATPQVEVPKHAAALSAPVQPPTDRIAQPASHQERIPEISSNTSVSYLIESMGSHVGRVRQAAVMRSVAIKDPQLFPAIVERLNDWVPQVRDAARFAVMTMLPIMPASEVIATLPNILKLRTARRSDHSGWLTTFTLELLRGMPPDALLSGLTTGTIQVARAIFLILNESPSVDKSTVLRIALTQRRDILLATQAACMIGQLPLEEQQMRYETAMQSHFGSVRTIAIQGLLGQQFSETSRRIATSALRDPQSSVRGAAIAHLLANCVDVAAYYRELLAAPSTSPGTVRMCLIALAGLRHAEDTSLVRSFVSCSAIQVRAAAFASWLRLVPADKDEIAVMAISDTARSIIRAGLEMSHRHGAFIPFHTAFAIFSERKEWSLLLVFAQTETWSYLEAIARTALLTGGEDPVRPDLKLELRKWISASRSFTRPTKAQLEFFLAPETIRILESIAPHDVQFGILLRQELDVVRGTRS